MAKTGTSVPGAGVPEAEGVGSKEKPVDADDPQVFSCHVVMFAALIAID